MTTPDLVQWSRDNLDECVCAGRGFISLNVPPGNPLFGQAIPCYCKVREMDRRLTERLARRSGISQAENERYTFDAFMPERSLARPGQDASKTRLAMQAIKDACVAYAAAPKGWLVLQGERGVGKTHLAYAIGNAALARGLSVFCHTVPELLDTLRSSYAREGEYEALMADLKGVRILVLDDLGAQKETDWSAEKLFEIVNARYRQMLPLVVTTNYAIDQAGCPIDERILSRLRDGIRAGDAGLVRILRMPVRDYRPTNNMMEANNAQS
jgi:DNA replication protein DnaC